MTKQDAIAVLQQRIDVIEDDQAYSMLTKSMYEDGYRRIEAFKMAIAALNEVGSTTTQLDENGLMPCGCGGKAHVYMPVSVYSLYIIGCERCRVRITFPNKVNEAKNEWNAAMGYKEADE